VTAQEYQQMVHSRTPHSPLAKDCLMAFLFGGGISCFGQVLRVLYERTGLAEADAKLAVSVTLIVLTAVLTATGAFAKIARVAGAGTAVPITGFANSVVSPAVEFNAEGRVLGTAAKMFSLAGPVIVYGCGAAALYGLILFLTGAA